ncbi:MAG: RNA polymerase sigma factor RpoD/SigA [Candidatus Latescibacterota bacterium]
MVAYRTEFDPVDLYWRDIKDTEPLSREAEVELFQRVRAGDEQARQVLVKANLRFVLSVAHDYRDFGMSLIDLVSEGNMGLMEAIRRFDETRGFKFITYAVWWIRQAMLKALAEHGRAARPPMSQINDLIRIEKEAGALTQALGRHPTHEEIAGRAGMSRQRVLTALEASQQSVSLDAPAYAGDETPLGSVLRVEQEGVDERLHRADMEKAVQGCLGVLDAREYHIIRAYFGLEGDQPQTMEEIGASMGVTRERVRQLRNRALRKLRQRGGEQLAAFSDN